MEISSPKLDALFSMNYSPITKTKNAFVHYEDESVHFRGPTSIHPSPALRMHSGLTCSSACALTGAPVPVYWTLFTGNWILNNIVLRQFDFWRPSAVMNLWKFSAQVSIGLDKLDQLLDHRLPFLSGFRLLTPPDDGNYNRKICKNDRLFRNSRDKPPHFGV